MATHKLLFLIRTQRIGCVYTKIARTDNGIRDNMSEFLFLCHVCIFIENSLQVAYHTVIKYRFVIIIIIFLVVHQIYHNCTFGLVEH